MRGKIGIVIGLGAGYVLGSRAGRQRYEQIKSNFLKVWNTAPVQKQVDKAKDLGKTAALALPSAVWDGAVKVTKAATRSGTPGQKVDRAVQAGKASAKDVARGAEVTADEVKKAADTSVADLKKAVDTSVADSKKSTDR